MTQGIILVFEAHRKAFWLLFNNLIEFVGSSRY